MKKNLKCPICGKALTESEYDKALGLWKDKQQHIKHLQEEKAKIEQERRSLEERERTYKKQIASNKNSYRKALEAQKKQLEQGHARKLANEIKAGVEKAAAGKQRELRRREAELSKTQHKMKQLERSLRISADKYEQASAEIKTLKEQISKGITPQIEGLLEENKLLTHLQKLFPADRFEHPGKAGDIIHCIIENNKEIGKIVYECKRVKTFNRGYIDQAKQARRKRNADYAILVTNSFPSKKQYYFVEDTVFVVSPLNLEPITYTLRESLVRINLLRISSANKEQAVQRVYDYLSSSEYCNGMNDIASQLVGLARDLKKEIDGHRHLWEKRYSVYKSLFNDVGKIDYKLRELIQSRLSVDSRKLLSSPQKFFPIRELD